MKIIEIETLENGSHRNQTGQFKEIPNGWAVIPNDMETPNFPFGEIETKDEDIIKVEVIDGEEIEKVIGTRKVVTKWTANPIPEVADDIVPNEMEQLRADIDYISIMTGVDL